MMPEHATSPTTSPPAPIVIALGGNAISPPGEPGSIDEQFAHTAATAKPLAAVIDGPAPVVITHGNGPQIGSAVRRVELSAHEVYDLPLSICVADLQGGMGYMISQCLNNELAARGCARRAVALVTSVEVDGDDPAFGRPSKPIGPFYPPDRARTLEADGWDMIEVPGRGFRRVVPSPQPEAIVEIDLVRQLAASRHAVITAGGGGVPVVRDADGRLSGRDAVVDKDRASSLLACAIGAARLVMVTNVPAVCVDFGTPEARSIAHLPRDEARMHLEAGQFPPGSMGPKIEGALAFLDRCGTEDADVIICSIESLQDALAGRAGTRMTR